MSKLPVSSSADTSAHYFIVYPISALLSVKKDWNNKNYSSLLIVLLFLSNLTIPSAVANSVSSPPIPTLRPG